MAYRNLKNYVTYIGNNPYIGTAVKPLTNNLNYFIDQLGVKYSDGVWYTPYFLGNLIAAVLNSIAYFIDIVLGREKDGELHPYCDWLTTDINRLGTSVCQMFFRGICYNLLTNLIDLIQDGVCRRPYNIYKAAMNSGMFFVSAEKTGIIESNPIRVVNIKTH